MSFYLTQKDIDNNKPLLCVHYEHISIYAGRRTIRALKMRLAKSIAYGDTTARFLLYSHQNDSNYSVFINAKTGELEVTLDSGWVERPPYDKNAIFYQ